MNSSSPNLFFLKILKDLSPFSPSLDLICILWCVLGILLTVKSTVSVGAHSRHGQKKNMDLLRMSAESPLGRHKDRWTVEGMRRYEYDPQVQETLFALFSLLNY